MAENESSSHNLPGFITRGLPLATKYMPSIIGLIGLALISLGFVKFEGREFSTRDSAFHMALIIGFVMLLVAACFQLLNRAHIKSQDKRTIVFYAPTIKANSFFAECLESAAEKVKARGFRLAIETGDEQEFHLATNYTNVLRDHAKAGAIRNTVIIMIPPNPEALESIWSLPAKLAVNLITLDMDVAADKWQLFKSCSFHKKVILVDNRAGACQAAEQLVGYCRENRLQKINVLICEGNLHGRGEMFWTEALRLADEEQGNLELRRIGKKEKLDFSEAFKRSKEYVEKSLGDAKDELPQRETVVFCANDNMAIGARMVLSQVANRTPKPKPLKIICFDYSTFVRLHMNAGDPFFWRAIDQNLQLMVSRAIDAADDLFKKENVEKEVLKIPPTVRKK